MFKWETVRLNSMFILTLKMTKVILLENTHRLIPRFEINNDSGKWRKGGFGLFTSLRLWHINLINAECFLDRVREEKIFHSRLIQSQLEGEQSVHNKKWWKSKHWHSSSPSNWVEGKEEIFKINRSSLTSHSSVRFLPFKDKIRQPSFKWPWKAKTMSEEFQRQISLNWAVEVRENWDMIYDIKLREVHKCDIWKNSESNFERLNGVSTFLIVKSAVNPFHLIRVVQRMFR